MSVDKLPGVYGVPPVGQRGREKPGHEQNQNDGAPEGDAPHYTVSRDTSRAFDDVTSFLGIPEDELTPAVEDAIVAMMQEVEELRKRLSHAQEHESYLKEIADQDPLMPVLNRRALTREIRNALAHSERTGASNTYVYIQLQNLDRIKEKFGLQAAETALVAASEILSSNLSAPDQVGTLGSGDFGVILTLSEGHEAGDRAKKLIEELREKPVAWEGHQLILDAECGVHVLQVGEEVEEVLGAGDAKRMTQSGDETA